LTAWFTWSNNFASCPSWLADALPADGGRSFAHSPDETGTSEELEMSAGLWHSFVISAVRLVVVVASVSAQETNAAVTEFFGNTPSSDQWANEDCIAVGRYVNHWYGFVIQIPRGLHGCPNSPIGMSDHGTWIPLRSSMDRGIECYAAYNAMFHQTVDDAMEDDLGWITTDIAVPGSVQVIRRSRSKLGTLPAARVVLVYLSRKSGTAVVEDRTSALRSINRKYEAPSHEYSVTLHSTPAAYGQDLSILEEVLRTWHIGPSFDEQ